MLIDELLNIIFLGFEDSILQGLQQILTEVVGGGTTQSE